MTHEQFRELLPLYVAGTLKGAKLIEFKHYVAANRRRCEAEIADWQASTDQPALAAPIAEPSGEVSERALETVEPAWPSARNYRRPERARLDFSALVLGWMPWTATAILCVLLIGAGLTRREALRRAEDQAAQAARHRTILAQQNKQISELKTQLEEKSRQQDEVQRRVEQLRVSNGDLRRQVQPQDLPVASLNASLGVLLDPATRVVQMTDPSRASKSAARAYWNESKKTGVVVVSNLAPVVKGQGKCLELWVYCGDQPPMPAGLF
jgi:hypothetical protein